MIDTTAPRWRVSEFDEGVIHAVHRAIEEQLLVDQSDQRRGLTPLGSEGLTYAALSVIGVATPAPSGKRKRPFARILTRRG